MMARTPKEERRKLATLVTPAPGPGLERRILATLERHSLVFTVALVLLASLRMAATYTVYNHTSDEPAHIACGMEWLDKGVYRWEPQHPPLSRVAVALGPYLCGIRSQNTPRDKFLAMSYEGLAVLYSGHHYDRTLALARLGNLPFFWLACAAVYWWGVRYYSRALAVVAVFLFSFLPPVLGHGGLATTDMACTAGMAIAFVAGSYWLERPSWARGAGFGAATGVMVLCKYSVLLFFPAVVAFCLVWYLVTERPGMGFIASALKQRLPSLALAVLVAVLVIWAGFRFSFGDSGIAHLKLPAPELFAGIRQVAEHNAYGHDSYLLGVRGHTGFFWFFPVALSVKTPLAFLFFLFVGIALVFRKHKLYARPWIPLAFSAAILIPSLFSSINIGVRHILPIYLGFTMLAAIAVVRMMELAETRRWIRIGLGVMMLWYAGSSLLSHPDYLPYFNALAGSEPEKILADSDLDWGQDLKRLSARLHQVGATSVSFDRYIVGDWEKEHGFPKIYKLNQYSPSVGWNAIGVGLWKESRLVLWPDAIKPQERVGKSILLWYFPPP
ncbi:MAG TPA: glycosyltransferase family 39 protein [Candidatus Sulfopaludibacter sp.]|nr:glycosyltransferase family 39 protein [Candidatus Sulfopaludibacter sp.]